MNSEIFNISKETNWEEVINQVNEGEWLYNESHKEIYLIEFLDKYDKEIYIIKRRGLEEKGEFEKYKLNKDFLKEDGKLNLIPLQSSFELGFNLFRKNTAKEKGSERAKNYEKKFNEISDLVEVSIK